MYFLFCKKKQKEKPHGIHMLQQKKDLSPHTSEQRYPGLIPTEEGKNKQN